MLIPLIVMLLCHAYTLSCLYITYCWLLGLFCICVYDCYHYVVNKDEYIYKQFTLRCGLTVRIKMSLVTAWTGRMTAHIVWDRAAGCSRLVVLWRQSSWLQNCCVSGPTDNECLSVGRTQLSDRDVGDERTVVGQVTRETARQGPADKSCYLEYDREPV